MNKLLFIIFTLFVICMFDISNSADVPSGAGLSLIDGSDKTQVQCFNFCNTQEVEISVQDISTTNSAVYSIIVKPGTTITVIIKGNPTTGYTHKMITVPNESIVKAISTEPDYVANKHEEMMVGYGGNYYFRFQATGIGGTSAVIEYARYFEQNPKCAFKTEIQFKVVEKCSEQILKE